MSAAFAPDIAFLDIGMPGMNGYELAQRLREQRGTDNLMLVAVTGWGQQQDQQMARAATFDHYLTKPPHVHAVKEILDEAARKVTGVA